ncbi:MAG: metallophosphoesterase, partial [DPANN group archaeon]|nr:metallophosphoesterase [DPANN group archaeon]
MKLGVTSDLHGSLGKARKFASYFKKSDVDAIVLAGDTPSEEKQGQSLTKILKIFVKTGKKVFILPGSHEQYVPYYAALKKSSKVTDCTKTFVAKIDYQKIVFIPGADSTASGAGFKILRDRKQYKRFRKRVRELKAHF